MSVTVTDIFAGAGGSSSGMNLHPDVEVRIAANHWQLAIDVHQANHPDADHAAVDLHEEDPRFFPRTDILWASPECTKWSQASGSRYASVSAEPDLLDLLDPDLIEDDPEADAVRRSRLLMFDVLRFVEHHRYAALIVENVVDIATSPRYATPWAIWLASLRNLGYDHRVVSLNSMHAQAHGDPAPQSRDRVYIVAWQTGMRAPDIDRVLRPAAWCPTCDAVIEARQAWKNGRKVGKYRAQYIYIHSSCGTAVEPAWLPAAAAIDWTLPGKRIGDRARPLADKTRARIAAGIARYWRPFTLEAAGNTYERRPGVRTWPADHPLTTLHTTASKALAVPVEGREGKQAKPLDVPLRTMTTRAETALVSSDCPPFLAQFRDRIRNLDPAVAPLPTVVADGANHGLVQPFVAELRGGGSDARSTDEPLSTVTAGGNHHALIEPFILERRGEYRTRPISDPVSTLTANDTTKALISPAGGSWNDDALPVDEPHRTLTTRDAYSLVTPYYGRSDTAHPVDRPIGTLTTHDKYALIQRHNTSKGDGAEMLTPACEPLRTITTMGHQSLITPGDVAAAEAMVDDCLFRMLEPHEIAAGMAFPTTYRWDVRDSRGRLPSRRNLVKMAGNAVTPPAARDLIAAVVEALGGDAA